MQFNIKRIHMLKDLLIQLRQQGSSETIQENIEQYFKEVTVTEVLLIEHQLINGDYDITIEDIRRLSAIYPHLYIETMDEADHAKIDDPGHPLQILQQENKAFKASINQINYLLASYEKDPEQFEVTDMIDVLKQQVFKLGEFHNHYNRKEKVIFPILERYEHFELAKMMWRGDDRVRALYKGTKNIIDQMPNIAFKHVQVIYGRFLKAFEAMIFQEDAILLPILLDVFDEDDWLIIASESDAFGYALHEPTEKWAPATTEKKVMKEIPGYDQAKDVDSVENIRFGGGYLTTEEANLILNHLPLEITFVDKNSLFKYFNKITEASEMMLIRTPVSIGRNVANCHPPKSLHKVMTIIRDLKTGRRTSEEMWFKMKDQYIHITYKPLFNESDDFLGVLEYVQNIQPFFELPTEVKRGLTNIEE